MVFNPRRRRPLSHENHEGGIPIGCEKVRARAGGTPELGGPFSCDFGSALLRSLFRTSPSAARHAQSKRDARSVTAIEVTSRKIRVRVDPVGRSPQNDAQSARMGGTTRRHVASRLVKGRHFSGKCRQKLSRGKIGAAPQNCCRPRKFCKTRRRPKFHPRATHKSHQRTRESSTDKSESFPK